MGTVKEWLLEVGLKKFGPSAIRGGILAVFGWILMKEGFLSSYGIVSDAANHTTTIYWDKLSVALIVGLPAITAGIIKIINYHGSELIPKDN